MGLNEGRTTRNRPALTDIQAPCYAQPNHGRYIQKLAR